MKLFIAGTDTEVGKTYVSTALLRWFRQQQYSSIALKPIASGCEWVNGKLRNSDALILQQQASITIDYNQINPFAYAPAIAPHIAAEQVGEQLTVNKIQIQLQPSLQQASDITLVEGVGGWHVPLNQQENMADLVKRLELSVILVVGMRLGCLNHAILTAQAIAQSGLPFLGWIANCIEPDMPVLQENIATLKNWIKAPCLDVIAFQQAVFNGVLENK